jgi:hypothetical protein
MKAHGDRSAAGGLWSIALFVGEASAWDAAEVTWKAKAKEFGVFPFRMTNFIATVKDHDRRMAIMKPLIEIIHQTALIGSVTVMNEADWGLIPSVLRERLSTQYLVLATSACAQISQWRKTEGHTDKWAVVFESGNEEGQSIFRETTRLLLDRSDFLQARYDLEDIIFAPKERAGLSMADCLAWLMTHCVPELHVDDGISHDLIDMIIDKVPIKRHYFTRGELIQAARREDVSDDMRALGRQLGVYRP